MTMSHSDAACSCRMRVVVTDRKGDSRHMAVTGYDPDGGRIHTWTVVWDTTARRYVSRGCPS